MDNRCPKNVRSKRKEMAKVLYKKMKEREFESIRMKGGRKKQTYVRYKSCPNLGMPMLSS